MDLKQGRAVQCSAAQCRAAWYSGIRTRNPGSSKSAASVGNTRRSSSFLALTSCGQTDTRCGVRGQKAEGQRCMNQRGTET